ncbi:hypothetical protein HJG60_008540 [Phyllostomus discolor]|uniref:Uncharacterized protein n=1 Tax=Phyllostomus discolor TaxID=89673 RepID=A0A834DKE0_9CHIR|nr:hypothetical protein HJG60_008540 [Phyllostomus discolor]
MAQELLALQEAHTGADRTRRTAGLRAPGGGKAWQAHLLSNGTTGLAINPVLAERASEGMGRPSGESQNTVLTHPVTKDITFCSLACAVIPASRALKPLPGFRSPRPARTGKFVPANAESQLPLLLLLLLLLRQNQLPTSDTLNFYAKTGCRCPDAPHALT